MHFRRFAALLLGAWLGGCLLMDMVATQNFRAVDRLLAAPSLDAAERIRALGGHEGARIFLRYEAAEENRWYFENWERIQIGLGLALFFVLLFGSFPDNLTLALVLVMFAIVMVMRFFITPEITRLGRMIDFVPPGTPSGERTRFWMFHGAYSGSELVKLGLGVWLAARLAWRHRILQTAQVDTVDKRDHSHIDR
jgi:hypothetical protein